MGAINFLFEPFVFYALLAILVFGAFYIIFTTLGRNQDEQHSEQKLGIDRRFSELDTQKSDQEKLDIQKALSSKEKELKICSQEKDSRLKEVERLKSSVSSLETQLKEKAEALKKESSGREESQNKLKSLEKELADLKTDLSLKSQMYNGLKSQYEELEQNMIRGSGPKEGTDSKSPGKEKDLLSRIENPEEKEG